MSSVLTAVFEAAIGLLVNKARDEVAKKLKDGDVADQKFHGLIVREIDDIKSKLDGLARKDLLTSISFFREGIELLYEVFQKVKLRSQKAETQASAAEALTPEFDTETLCIAKRMAKLELTDLDDSALSALSNARRRFKDARRKATEAFANEALELSDRVLAMRYRIMATILEAVDNPEGALPTLRVCIEELHSLSPVKEYFTTELKKGFWAWFSKEERRTIISTVCHMNRVVYDVTRMVTKRKEQLLLPIVETENRRVDPLRDAEVSRVLYKIGMEHCCVTPWFLGEGGEEEHKLKNPTCIAGNENGQFIVGDTGDNTVKVFDNGGKFVFKFDLQTDEADTTFPTILNVASDVNSNTYVLVGLKQSGTETLAVQVYNSANFVRKFPVRGVMDVVGTVMCVIFSVMTITNNKLFILRYDVVDVYELDGRYVRTFGEGILKGAVDIIDSFNGQVEILDFDGFCVRRFTEDGQQRALIFNIFDGPRYFRYALHPSREYVIFAEFKWSAWTTSVSILNKDGECERVFEVEGQLKAITKSKDGCIALAVSDAKKAKVIVL